MTSEKSISLSLNATIVRFTSRTANVVLEQSCVSTTVLAHLYASISYHVPINQPVGR